MPGTRVDISKGGAEGGREVCMFVCFVAEGVAFTGHDIRVCVYCDTRDTGNTDSAFLKRMCVALCMVR